MQSPVLVLFLAIAANCYTVRYYLYTSEKTENAVVINSENIMTNIDLNKPAIFLLHGFSVVRDPTMFAATRKVLLDRQPLNIIEVDYHSLTVEVYPVAVEGVPAIAAKIAQLIHVMTLARFPLRSITIIGHSIGGQIAGFIGQYLKVTYGHELGKIIALDPIGPLFQDPVITLNGQLDKDDARIVLVLHTNTNQLGYKHNCGDIDIYINGGVGPQPGRCSHDRGWQFFHQAISHNGSIMATKCPNIDDFRKGRCMNNTKIDVGAEVDTKHFGTYFLKATEIPPYKYTLGIRLIIH